MASPLGAVYHAPSVISLRLSRERLGDFSLGQKYIYLGDMPVQEASRHFFVALSKTGCRESPMGPRPNEAKAVKFAGDSRLMGLRGKQNSPGTNEVDHIHIISNICKFKCSPIQQYIVHLLYNIYCTLL